MRAVEAKARVDEFTDVQKTLKDLGARRGGEWEEKDVYFKVKRGKYKLKTDEDGKSALLFYFKDAVKGAKLCVCEKLPLKERGKMSQFLQANFGQGVEIKRKRSRYMLDSIRIFLDDVLDIGKFVKIEAPVDPTTPVHDAKKHVDDLVKKFRFTDRELTSYTYDELHRIATLKK
ncbi:MAG: CYTH domain-containing protein [Nitrospirae bacterium]|nr:CYTH domain-containing protein [Nitrospirota bacterium]